MARDRYRRGESLRKSRWLGSKRGGARTTSGSSLLLALIFFLAVPPVAQAGVWCGELTRQYGPYDYTNPQHRARHLGVVERVHFTEDVRTLRKGSTSYLARDIEYVLNWFPNHHQALDAFVRLALREGTTRPERSSSDIECRFQWAIQIQPRDAMVRVIRANYYHRSGRPGDAREQLHAAMQLEPENPEVHYNLGLALVNLRDFENARTHAEEAYRGGYPLPGLRNMLERAGYPLQEAAHE